MKMLNIDVSDEKYLTINDDQILQVDQLELERDYPLYTIKTVITENDDLCCLLDISHNRKMRYVVLPNFDHPQLPYDDDECNFIVRFETKDTIMISYIREINNKIQAIEVFRTCNKI